MSDSLEPHGLWPAKLLCPWGFSKQEYWSGVSFPSSGDLLNPGINPAPPVSPALAGGFFTSEPPGKLFYWKISMQILRLQIGIKGSSDYDHIVCCKCWIRLYSFLWSLIIPRTSAVMLPTDILFNLIDMK